MTRQSGPALTEVAQGIYVQRYPVLDVNATLIVGGEVAVVVDTLATDAQASQLRDQVRRVTELPLVLINTHHHFDHCFGNAAFAGEAADGTWGHEAAARTLLRHGQQLQRQWYAEYAEADPELAQGLANVTIMPPTRTVHTQSTMDIGGRHLDLRHFGRGHTDGDLVVVVPDADVLLAGDLVEQGAPPSFGDGYPLEWPDTLSQMLHLITPTTVVVPGHGAPVDRAFVRAQHDDLTALDWLIRDGHADGAPMEAVAARAPFGPQASLVAVRRGYAELAGRA